MIKLINLLKGIDGEKMMYWTVDDWVECEKENTNPFRVKKDGDTFKFDFVSWEEWEKIMENEE